MAKRRRGRPSRTVRVREDDIAILSRRKSRTKRRRAQQALSFEWTDADDWAPYMSADWVLAEVADAVHAAHVNAIERGVRAGTGHAQPALDPKGTQGRLARKGKRPDIRGVTGRHDGRGFADELLRTEIKARGNAKIGKGRVGTGASCEIKPGTAAHAQFVKREKAYEGVEYFDVTGPVEAILEIALSEVIDKALVSPPKKKDAPELGPVRGKDLR